MADAKRAITLKVLVHQADAGGKRGIRMQYEKHVFISYAHIDNQSLTAEQEGWITRFHASLGAILSQRLGCSAKIWRDDKLQGNDIFSDEITGKLPQTAVLISILTPRYVESEWCSREAKAFCDAAELTGGLVVNNKSRIVKVIKTPVESEAGLPDAMSGALGYPFYVYRGEAPVELDPAFGDDLIPKLNEKLAVLAWDIAQLLRSLDQSEPTAPEQHENNTEGLIVYLAECAFDGQEARAALEANLRLHGHRVLPDSRLPQTEAEYEREVATLLETADLSIHIVGQRYVPVLDGPGMKSAAAAQNELAIEESRKRGLNRLIWLPIDSASEDPKQQAFIDALHNDDSYQLGADIITGTDTEFTNAVMRQLQEQLKKPAVDTPEETSDSEPLVYLICTKDDREAARPLRKRLHEAGLVTQIPLFEGESKAVREEHQTLLASCDSTLIFYGAGDEGWRRVAESDVKKAAAYRADKPRLIVYTYLATPSNIDKDELVDFAHPNLLNGLALEAGEVAAEFPDFIEQVAKLG